MGHNHWLGTVSGRKIDFINPDPDEINIEDIATGLSNVARFAGQTEGHYSVAQHSHHCSVYCNEYPLEALLHDASEAYMGDCPRPLKDLLGDGWRDVENNLMEVIAAKFGFQWPLPPEVKDVDDRMLFTERRYFQPRHVPWPWRRQPYRVRLMAWLPHEARKKFLERFHYLTAAKEEAECLQLSK